MTNIIWNLKIKYIATDVIKLGQNVVEVNVVSVFI